MIAFKINEVRIFIPTRWADVTAEQYVALLTLAPTLRHHIGLFTNIPIAVLEVAEIKNLEKISEALDFLNYPPEMGPGPTPMVGRYIIPVDVSLQSVGQFEDLRALLNKFPRNPDGTFPQALTIDDNIKIADLYLTACAIYVQKIKDGKYDFAKVPEIKEELNKASCIEVMQTGAFFLFRPLNSSRPSTNRFRKLTTRLKKWIQALPGYQKTLDSLQRSSK